MALDSKQGGKHEIIREGKEKEPNHMWLPSANPVCLMTHWIYRFGLIFFLLAKQFG